MGAPHPFTPNLNGKGNGEMTEQVKNTEQQGQTGARHGQGLGDTLWKYEQIRAGQVYNQFMFNTREEAENFAARMKQVAPDLFGHIEQIQASAIWN